MKIKKITAGSEASRKGISKGDIIESVNGYLVNDQIDFMFYGSEQKLKLVLKRGTETFKATLNNSPDMGIELEDMKIKSCGNKCLFCFIDQNPKGMRKEIYVKDEDYRLSFLYGSYITLNSLREPDLKRIIEQRLSPLYISVHSTDKDTRMKMLGIKRESDLLETIDTLIDNGISLHCQIVVCPGINDGKILKQTLDTLAERKGGIASIAAVPVGLTKHRDNLYPLSPVDSRSASEIIGIVDEFHSRFRRETGTGFVYSADEFYIKAGYDIPPEEYYDDFPQIENGVGMLRDFLNYENYLDELEKFEPVKRKLIFVTGVSMSGYISEFAAKVKRYGIEIAVSVTENSFYGNTVTVSGLLTGDDILRTLKNIGPGKNDIIVIPPNCLNTGECFLDGMKPKDISKELGLEIIQGEYNPVSTLIETLRKI